MNSKATKPEDTSTTTRQPLSETERQDSAISSLPNDFQFPLFNGRHALESQRKSGYKNSARAAREIVDNAYEAGAKNVWVIFKRPTKENRTKRQRLDAVTTVAFIDDGPGMSQEMARFALSWGGGIRFEEPTGIGRFGFGLPNSSINQTRRVEVYTRRSDEMPWNKATLDITPERLAEIPPSGLVNIDAPVEAELPSFVQDYLKQKAIQIGSGTIVVWEKPDRLTARSAANLRKLMLDDFGVTYRYLLDHFNVIVDNKKVQKVDPLFLTPGALYYKSPEEGGATCTHEMNIPVKYYRDPLTGAQHLDWLQSHEAISEAQNSVDVEAIGTISVRVARFPYGFAAEKITEDGGTRKLPKESEEYKRLQIRKKRRGISYVRASREIDSIDNLPTTTADEANGLGNWPVLQAYALHWGLEVRFSPSLDEAFGIGNDKQTVNPIEDFWRVLAEAEIDLAARIEQQFQQNVRTENQKKAAKKQAENPDEPNPATAAADEAESAMGRPQALPQERADEAQERFKKIVAERIQKTKESIQEAEDAVKAEAARKKYAIKFFCSEGGVFFKPDYGNGLQKVAMINTAHPFFTFFYTELAKISNPRCRQAVDLLLLALAKAELIANDKVKMVLKHQREVEWSPFLQLGLGILDQLHHSDDENSEEDV
ncbi:MAG: ATP-binding protein [Planctomycetota bacterium]|jgi:hypothetical protein